jgi:hypothetical protein
MQRLPLLTVALSASSCAWMAGHRPPPRGPFCYAVAAEDSGGRTAILPEGIAFFPVRDSGHAVWLAGPQWRVMDGARAVLRGWGTQAVHVAWSTPRFRAELELRPSGRTLVGRGFSQGDVGPWAPAWVPVTATPQRCPAAVAGNREGSTGTAD